MFYFLSFYNYQKAHQIIKQKIKKNAKKLNKFLTVGNGIVKREELSDACCVAGRTVMPMRWRRNSVANVRLDANFFLCTKFFPIRPIIFIFPQNFPYAKVFYTDFLHAPFFCFYTSIFFNAQNFLPRKRLRFCPTKFNLTGSKFDVSNSQYDIKPFYLQMIRL